MNYYQRLEIPETAGALLLRFFTFGDQHSLVPFVVINRRFLSLRSCSSLFGYWKTEAGMTYGNSLKPLPHFPAKTEKVLRLGLVHRLSSRYPHLQFLKD